MPAPDDLPADIRLFILDKIDSVPHLEALLLTWEQRAAVWSDDALARALYVDTNTARKVALELEKRSWVKFTDDHSFCYDSAWDPDGSFMQRLAGAYRRQLIRITKLIHGKSSSSAVRDFAQAFDFKKE